MIVSWMTTKDVYKRQLLHRPLGGEPVGHLPSHPPVPGRRSLPVGRAFVRERLHPLAVLEFLCGPLPSTSQGPERTDLPASRPRHLL